MKMINIITPEQAIVSLSYRQEELVSRTIDKIHDYICSIDWNQRNYIETDFDYASGNVLRHITYEDGLDKIIRTIENLYRKSGWRFEIKLTDLGYVLKVGV